VLIENIRKGLPENKESDKKVAKKNDCSKTGSIPEYPSDLRRHLEGNHKVSAFILEL
jgi:hypothetical protein